MILPLYMLFFFAVCRSRALLSSLQRLAQITATLISITIIRPLQKNYRHSGSAAVRVPYYIEKFVLGSSRLERSAISHLVIREVDDKKLSLKWSF